MASKATTIKQNIKALLEELQREQVIRDVKIQDPKKSIFQLNFSKYPAAVLTSPLIDSAAETNTQNLRVYTFEIMVICKAEEVTDDSQIEDLRESILDKFDNDVTLKGAGSIGAADGGLSPSASRPEPVTSGSNEYIVFSVILTAKALRDLTFR